MIDLEKYTQEYWGLMRQHAYRLTGSILDADVCCGMCDVLSEQ